MLRIDSFVHRSSLSEVISRWVVGKPAPGDVMRLKTVVNFNLYIARLWVDWFARDLLEVYHGVAPVRLPVSTKGQLKDFAVTHPRYMTARIEEMLLTYGRCPEDFYRDTPMDGMIYGARFGAGQEFVGSARIKRFQRIAEKGSRRIVDFMLKQIRANADLLAEERARILGIPKDQLITPREKMAEEFHRAESRILESIKQGALHAEHPELEIPDVAGVKIIVEPQEYAGFRELVGRMPGIEIAEEEHHIGNYNGINLKLKYAFPKKRLLAEPMNESYRRVLAYRGFNPDEVDQQYLEFVGSAEDEVSFEMIVSSYQEFLESEIGRCMHEERIQAQRANYEYNGLLATNIRYLMEFMLSLCRSPWRADLEEVPVKPWVKYMPDAIERVVRKLYIPEEFLFDTIDTASTAPPDTTASPSKTIANT
jgi:hypothetical protein